MSSVNVSYVSSAVVDLLTVACAPTPVGDGETPGVLAELSQEERLRNGYLVVSQIPSGERYGGSDILGEESSLEWVRYQIVAVGHQRDQVEEIAAFASAKLVDRDANGEFLTSLALDGHVIINRKKAGRVPTDSGGVAWNAGEHVDLLVTIQA